ncbi:MAG TPA: hypothetical protein VHZ81_05055 [Galbitalea sp.]|jgi:hypothetical protein|nr:hypothetical protein [Galbitalea sp.]
MTTLDFVGSQSTFLSAAKVNRFGIVLVQLHDELWRVTRRSGEVLGYIESFTQGGDAVGGSVERRFRAKRMFSSRRPSMPLGEFWTIDDAIDCFRFS